MSKSKRIIFTTLEQAISARAERDAAIGPPVRGVHIGEGIHVSMPETWDGAGAVPLGWSGFDGEMLDGTEYVIGAPAEISGLLGGKLKTDAVEIDGTQSFEEM